MQLNRRPKVARAQRREELQNGATLWKQSVGEWEVIGGAERCGLTEAEGGSVGSDRWSRENLRTGAASRKPRVGDRGVSGGRVGARVG